MSNLHPRRTFKRQSITQLLLLLTILVLVNVLASAYYFRFDLTKEKRYTLTDPTKTMLRELDEKLMVRVYLEGEFPAGFVRLRNATREILHEFRAYAGGQLEFEFIDPSAMGDSRQEREQFYGQLVDQGLQPTNLRVQGDESYSQRIIFPGAIITYKGQKMPVDLLQNQPGLGPQEKLNNSIAALEFGFASTIRKLLRPERSSIAFIRGQQELEDALITDVVRALNPYYKVEWIDLKETLYIPQDYKTLIVAKPLRAFREQDKFKLDQYLMHGGTILWLVERVHANMDSLQQNNAFLARPINLNLEDQLFKYGVRVNQDLIQDLRCAPIPIMLESMGRGGPQQELRPWYYFPLLYPASSHPIVKNLDGVLGRFVSSIDTIRTPGIRKTVLLHTSRRSRVMMSPVRIHMAILRHEPPAGMFNKPHKAAAVLLEGEFESLFKGRLSPRTLAVMDSLDIEVRDKSKPTRMIVVSDGDLIRNDINREGKPYPLGFYPFNREMYANKDFIINAVEYLCDESGIIEARTKDFKLRLLDKSRVNKESLRWQVINMAGPLLFLLVFGFIYNFVKVKRYTL